MTAWGPDRLAALARLLPDAVVAIDATATIVWAGGDAEALLGHHAGELVGRNAVDLIDPRDAETAVTALLRTRESGGPKQPWPFRILDDHGESHWMELAPTNLLDDPEVAAVVVTIRALERRDAVAAEARSVEELFRRAFDDAPIGMALVDRAGRIARANEALCALLERPMVELLGAEANALTHPDDLVLERPLAAELAAGTRRSYELDKRFILPDGSSRWVCVGVSLVRTPEGDPERFVVHVQDIADRKQSEAELAHRATHDPLTGLANRALFVDRLEIALARSERLPTSVAVLFCDVDGFKAVNDELGHDASDQVLAEVAARLRAAVRPGDTVARFGGDEFVVLCEDLVSPVDLDAIASRMERAVGHPIFLGGREVRVGLSIGRALSTGRETPADLVRDADAAMYAVKAALGR